MQAQQTLVSAERASARIRFRVNVMMSQLGWACLIYLFLSQGMLVGGSIADATGFYFLHFIGFPVGLTFLGLALMPTDDAAIRVTCSSIFSLLLFAGLVLISPGAGIWFLMEGDYQTGVVLVMWGIIFLTCAIGLAPTIVCDCCTGCNSKAMPPRMALLRLWWAIRLMLFGTGLTWGTSAIWSFATIRWNPEPNVILVFVLSCWATAALATPRNRGRALRFIGSIGKGESSKEQSAATIAALVGGGDAAGALDEGARRFRAIPISKIAGEDLLTNDGTGSSLFSRTEPVKFGECDAFVSHSWSDDGALKHAQLMSWANEANAPRRALVWLDKACIDQSNINASLRALPVFLSGCRELLVLAGPTYVTRLWCVLELFTFIKMGGEQSNISVHSFGGEDVRESLRNFNAGNAKCYLPRDRQRLLAVVEAGFGDFSPFNKLVREVLVKDKITQQHV